jgi:hypothetical protein
LATEQPDWPTIRVAFESGNASGRALGRKSGLSHTAIQKRARSANWTRPARAAPLAKEISPPIAVAAVADQRSIIDRGRDLVARLLDELHASTAHLGELEDLILAECAKDADGRRRHAMLQAVGLPTRAVVLKNLAMAAKTLADVVPGKKTQAGDAARTAATGRFSTPAAPRLVVNNE